MSKGVKRFMDVKEIHERIKNLASDRGMTIYALTKAAGLTRSSMYNTFERGTMPTIETLDQLCSKGLKISLSQFFSYWEEPGQNMFVDVYETELINISRKMNTNNKQRLISYAKGLSEAQEDKTE